MSRNESNADLIVALRNMTALAENMRRVIEGGSMACDYDIPNGFFNAAYLAIENADGIDYHPAT